MTQPCAHGQNAAGYCGMVGCPNGPNSILAPEVRPAAMTAEVRTMLKRLAAGDKLSFGSVPGSSTHFQTTYKRGGHEDMNVFHGAFNIGWINNSLGSPYTITDAGREALASI